MSADRIITIVVITDRPQALASFSAALAAAPGLRLETCADPGAATELVRSWREHPPQLVVIDHPAASGNPFGVAARLLNLDARVGSAVITPLSEEEAHEQGEGLGLVAVLPDPPTAADAARLLAALAAL